ncbi:MAG: FAD-dependent oxidoreductase [Lachnospiraceae bacterium]|nr:FAD-dependent oxidoreductase [Lachnospiraceae bacterium]
MIRINQLRVLIKNDKTENPAEKLKAKIKRLLNLKPGASFTYQIIRRSVDARKKPQLFYSYTVDIKPDFGANEKQSKAELEHNLIKKLKVKAISVNEEAKYSFPYRAGKTKSRPVIIGAGPAGLFCGYMLALSGFCPIILERGEAVRERTETINRFFNEGILNPESNVLFGEGGAGTFSDGKLSTQVKDPRGIKKAVLSILKKAGAPAEILYEQKPHLGTDVLRNIIKDIRKQIILNGGEVRFGQKVTGFSRHGNKITGVIINENEELKADYVILAIGHSARDTFHALYQNGVKMEAKPFSVGLRVEHPQVLINKIQHGVNYHKVLGAADYKLASKTAYSFCMCPGGFIVNASTEKGFLSINGMSYSDRAGESANSAIVMAVNPHKLGLNHPLSGIEYQRKLEEKAYQIGNGKIPVSYLGDFKKAVLGTEDLAVSTDKNIPSTKGDFCFAPVHEILDDEMNKAFLDAMNEFGQKIPGFDDDMTLVAGIESRTSSPVRIPRDEFFRANYDGLYPCGEGAGYAGGIISATMDGVLVAEAVAKAVEQMNL